MSKKARLKDKKKSLSAEACVMTSSLGGSQENLLREETAAATNGRSAYYRANFHT